MKTAENLCFGFGCWGKDFFAKVSLHVKSAGKTNSEENGTGEEKPSENQSKPWQGANSDCASLFARYSKSGNFSLLMG